MPALQQFFNAERLRRGWSMRETASWSRISLSKAYAISNGDDNVEFETFENIASAFNMSPAELAAAIGKGAPADRPEEVEFLALIRQVPSDKRPAAIDMLRGLAVQPTRKESANRRRDGAATGPNGPRRKLEAGTASAEERTAHGGLSDVYRRPGALWASVIAVVGRLLQPSHAWSTAEAG